MADRVYCLPVSWNRHSKSCRLLLFDYLPTKRKVLKVLNINQNTNQIVTKPNPIHTVTDRISQYTSWVQVSLQNKKTLQKSKQALNLGGLFTSPLTTSLPAQWHQDSFSGCPCESFTPLRLLSADALGACAAPRTTRTMRTGWQRALLSLLVNWLAKKEQLPFFQSKHTNYKLWCQCN